MNLLSDKPGGLRQQLLPKTSTKPPVRRKNKAKPEPTPAREFRVSITPSLRYTILLLCLHALTFFALWQTEHLPGPLLVPLSLLVLGSTILATFRSREYSTLTWRGDNHLQLSVERCANHQQWLRHWQQRSSGVLSPRSLHCSLFVLLELQDSNGKNHQCVIPRDAVSIADFRKLRARLYLHDRATA